MPKSVTSERPTDRSRTWSERYWRKHREDRNKKRDADFWFAANERIWLDFVNLVPGRPDAPEFHLASDKETLADKAAFEKFLDVHFPRQREKFRELRRGLELMARGKPALMAAKPYTPAQNYAFLIEHGVRRLKGSDRTSRMGVQTCSPEHYTPIKAYAFLVEQRKFLRIVSRYGTYFAKMTGAKRPALQICESCGKLFLARRVDQLTCSENCSAARRMARARALKKKEQQEATAEQRKPTKNEH